MVTKRPKLVLMEWIDPNTTSGPGWDEVEDIISGNLSSYKDYNISVGFLIYEDKKVVMLAAHIAGLTEKWNRTDASGDVCVPKACIVKRKNIPYKLKERS